MILSSLCPRGQQAAFSQHDCTALHLCFAGDGSKFWCVGQSSLVLLPRSAQELVPSAEKPETAAGQEGGELDSSNLLPSLSS